MTGDGIWLRETDEIYDENLLNVFTPSASENLFITHANNHLFDAENQPANPSKSATYIDIQWLLQEMKF